MDLRRQMALLTKFSSRVRQNPTLVFSVVVLALTVLSTHGKLDESADERLT